jgi:cobalt/nickel transport system permease protein
MMGVLGAFVFAAQMINFPIPGTGSSGHLGGGLLLAILLGPSAAFMVMASVLAVQAFFFADGGLLALGCNIFNLGFFPAFIAYPFVYRALVKDAYGAPRAWLGAIAGAVAGLLLGALGVVLETKASGIAALPFGPFALLMLLIHLAIGIVEGLATAALIAFMAQARPESLCADQTGAQPSAPLAPVLIGLLAAALIIGGAISWFASTHPDGLEWSIAKATGKEELAGTQDRWHVQLARFQEKTAFLPGYGFKSVEAESAGETAAAEPESSWPSVSGGTSLAGILGGLITLALAGLVGLALKAKARCRARACSRPSAER